MKSSVSVIVPAYNEESRIPSTLERLCEYLKCHFREFEIIIVDDGSSDDTASVVKALSLKLEELKLIQYEKNMGKGYAVRKGVLSSVGALVLMCDADLSTPIEELEKLRTLIDEAGFDIAIGSRGLRESDIIARQPWYREGMGKIFNMFVRTLVFGGIKDTQCGFKLFRGDVARNLFASSLINGFSFDVEILFLARKTGCRIKEEPVKWLNSPNSRVRLIRDPVKMFFELLKIRINWFAGRYKAGGRRSADSL